MSKKSKKTNSKRNNNVNIDVNNKVDNKVDNKVNDTVGNITEVRDDDTDKKNEKKKEVVDDLSTLKDDFFANLDREARVEDAIHTFREKSRNKASSSHKRRKRKSPKKLNINIPFVNDLVEKTGVELKFLICGCILSVLFLLLIIALVADRENINKNDTVVTTASQLKETTNKEIVKLINDYFNAISECDIDTLSRVMDSVGTITEEQLKKQSEYIEGYENIKIYTKAGIAKGEYVVYVYYENKILNIDTLAPGAKVMYVKRNETKDGYIIHNGIQDTDIANRIKELSKKKEVKEFNESVNDKLLAACKKDENLKNFYNALMSASSSGETTKEGETAAQETTKAPETTGETNGAAE